MSKLDIQPGKPFTLPDGTVVNPDNSTGDKVVTPEDDEITKELSSIFEEVEMGEFKETFQRTLADVNLPYKQMTSVLTILAYTMWGLPLHAIARILNVSQETVESIQSLEGYTKVKQELLEGIRYSESSTVHGFLTQKARTAAGVMATSLGNRSPDIRLAAAKDILDRSGFRPADKVEHHHKFEDDLRIVHITDKQVDDLPITIEHED